METCAMCGGHLVCGRDDMAPCAFFAGEPYHVGCAVLVLRGQGITGRLGNPRARAAKLTPGRS